VVLGERRMRAASAQQVDAELDSLIAEHEGLAEDVAVYEARLAEAYRSEVYQAEHQRLLAEQSEAEAVARARESACESLEAEADPVQLEALAKERAGLSEQLGALREALRNLALERDRLARRVARQQAVLEEVEKLRRAAQAQRRSKSLAERLSGLYQSMAAPVADVLRVRAAREAADIYEAVARDDAELVWLTGFGLALRREGRLFGFASLSRGERTNAAVAARLALLRQLPGLKLVLLDEPTAYLDAARRSELARALGSMARRSAPWVDQILVVSHDDAFGTAADQQLALIPGPEGTRVASR
jgi:DNA repair exonuclease SbcCD ATPase subunit